MTDPGQLLTALREYLIAQAIVRNPRVTAPGLPPLWLEPRDGVRAPNEPANASGNALIERGDPVLAAFHTGGIASRPYESELRDETVDIWFRASDPTLTFVKHAQVRDALIDRRDWTIGTTAPIYLLEVKEWTALQRLASDTQGFTHRASLLFAIRA